ncbi:helix-turn-helix domain-containing protein [Floccifex sp.]|uniref:helix-turn-helix domain-containing protein n=1 Tax=Floccifex sp. TaxID=2815810 RepID=UPI0029FEDFDD|nr:helix-turn-helix domain-containing protein [Floccifex sp.]MDD7282143.1 AraC family transcriptional regulator [Erysipelotrichaceae bacterium]MDY2959036.1 AraC family transcriptional regulator [Floccifex sp.]
MFKKTSSVDFLKYGEVYTDHTHSKESHKNNYILNATSDSITYFLRATDDVYLKSIEGISLLIITDDINNESYDEFVVHRIIKINKGNYFNVIPLGECSKVELAFLKGCRIENIFLEKEYSYHRILPEINIKELIAYYYNVRNSHYQFAGESLRYWEITYVDSGVLHTFVDGIEYVLHANELMIYGPNQFHDQNTHDNSCSYLSIIVDMDLKKEEDHLKLINKVFPVSRSMKASLDHFVEGSSTKSNVLLFSSLNRIISSLLLSETDKKVASTPMQQNFENELINEILLYINENIFSDFNNVEELCQHFGLSRSSLQNLFNNNLHIAPKRYILNMKLNKSKELIRESKYTISEISNLLGFSSIHYFSRRFKQEYGISPTEYANKIYKPE